jgi:hypothetical protein
MRDAQNGFRFQPISNAGPVEASGELPDTQILFRRDFIADVAFLSPIRTGLRLIQNRNKSLRRGWRVLHSGETPGMEVTKATSHHIRAVLQATGLKFLQELAQRTSRFVQNLQD